MNREVACFGAHVGGKRVQIETRGPGMLRSELDTPLRRVGPGEMGQRRRGCERECCRQTNTTHEHGGATTGDWV